MQIAEIFQFFLEISAFTDARLVEEFHKRLNEGSHLILS